MALTKVSNTMLADPPDTSGVQDDIALLAFKTQANGSLARYNLVDQSVDAFEDASGVDASASTAETRNAAGKYYSGVTDGASGGTKTTYTDSGTDYVVRTFLSNGDFVTPSAGTMDVLMVAGGASGGSFHAGGGGAGGMIVMPGLTAAATTYAAVVGAGGTAVMDSPGNNGANTTFFSETAVGGGRGGIYTTDPTGFDGGSGGGACGGALSGSSAIAGGSGTQGNPTSGTGYGNDGGGSQGNYTHAGGGGGGAGAVGAGAASASVAGNGGVGFQNLYRTGSNVYYSGGGGGGVWAGTKGTGGLGGGGNGSDNYNANNATAGTANSGGGGGAFGGQESQGTAGSGGSGIVVVRYADDQFVSGLDMTLVSNTLTSVDAVTKGDMVMTYTNGAGTASLNTDLKGWVSRDNGANYTELTLVSQGTTGGHTIVTAHDVTLGGTDTSQMRWKVTTENQSTAKETRIHAVSLGWT